MQGSLEAVFQAVFFVHVMTNTTNRGCEYTTDKRSLDNRNGSNRPNSIETKIHLLAKICSSLIRKEQQENTTPIVWIMIKVNLNGSRQYTWLYILTNNVA